MFQMNRLSSAQVRYLAALVHLDPDAKGVRSVKLATRLGVTRPSTHAMVAKLAEMGYVTKEHYGIIYLTEKGLEAGKKCRAYEDSGKEKRI